MGERINIEQGGVGGVIGSAQANLYVSICSSFHV
jgi:hypothetical protein